MVAIDFSKIYNEEYAYFDEDKQKWFLKENAPTDVIQLYKRYKELEDEERRTGRHIF